MEIGHKVALAGAFIAAAAAIAAAFISRPPPPPPIVQPAKKTFTVDGGTSEDCNRTCNALGARCVGATTVLDRRSRDCSFNGSVQLGDTFTFLKHRCHCQQ